MRKRLITATIRDQIAGQQVEVRVKYPMVQVKFLETGLTRAGRILPVNQRHKTLGILWDGDLFNAEDADLESDVLCICREAQLVWAREPQIIEEENAAP